MSRTHRRQAAGIAVLILLLSSGAYAYWTITGAGSGSAGTATPTAITVTQTSTITGLYPGGPAVALAGKFNNSNDGPLFVNEVNATIGTITGPGVDGPPACTAADFELSGFPVTVGAQVPSGTAQGNWSGGTIKLLNTSTNQDACKGASVNLVYTSS